MIICQPTEDDLLSSDELHKKAQDSLRKLFNKKRTNIMIVAEHYYVFEHSRITVCCLTLDNGLAVIGVSDCPPPGSFDDEMSKKVARSRAREKVRVLESHALRQKLMEVS